MRSRKFHSERIASSLFGITILLRALPLPAQEELAIRIPDKPLSAVNEEERQTKEAQLRANQELAVREREAVTQVETRRAASAKSTDMQIDSSTRRIKSLRERIAAAEQEINDLKPEIEELEAKAEKLEREARNLWDFPDLVQPNGKIYSNRAHAEALFAEAETYRTRADSRRTSLESRIRDVQRNTEEIRKLQGDLGKAIGRRETKEYEYQREIERVRKEIRMRVMEAVTTEDLVHDPGLLRQFNLGRDLESFILEFANTAQDAGEKWPLDQVLEAVESELRENEFAKLLEANSIRTTAK